jgi:hypothetical protein
MARQRVALDVVPGSGVGPFRLGIGVNDALALLRNSFLPRRPKVEVIYSAEAPLKKDLVLGVRELGMLLRFEPVSQRLRLLDVFDIDKLVLTYRGRPIAPRGTNTSTISFLALYKLLGPTFPGTFDENLKLYV